jgi:hypothetical protein
MKIYKVSYVAYYECDGDHQLEILRWSNRLVSIVKAVSELDARNKIYMASPNYTTNIIFHSEVEIATDILCTYEEEA